MYTSTYNSNTFLFFSGERSLGKMEYFEKSGADANHLGNVRLSYKSDGTLDPSTGGYNIDIVEESNYYPFGLKHKGYNSTNLQLNYKYQYNGKEYQDELGLNLYDFGARNYDAAIGRWMNIDPLAENSRRWTPYNYAYNNPIYFVDPDGMQADDWKRTKQGDYVYDASLTKENASAKLNEGESYVGESKIVTSGYGKNKDGTVKDVKTKHSLNADGSVTDLINLENIEAGDSAVLKTGNVINVNEDIDTSSNKAEVAVMKNEAEISKIDNKIDSLSKEITTSHALKNNYMRMESMSDKYFSFEEASAGRNGANHSNAARNEADSVKNVNKRDVLIKKKQKLQQKR